MPEVPVGVPVGTTATHEVDVRVVTPPSGSVVVSVFRTALEVVTEPVVTVSWVVVGATEVDDSSSITQSANDHIRATRILWSGIQSSVRPRLRRRRVG